MFDLCNVLLHSCNVLEGRTVSEEIMMAHVLEASVSSTSLGALYDRKTRFRITPRLVFAIGVVAAGQAVLGVYLANQIFVLKADPWVEPPVTIVELDNSRIKPPKPPAPPKQPELPQPREPVASIPTGVDVLPIPPAPPAPPQDPILQAPPAPPAAPPVVRAPQITNPKWLSRPTADQLARLYPSRAERMEKTGVAILNCEVTTDGLMDKCQIASEDPAEFGFGEAALRAARYFKISPPMSDGKPIEGAKIRIPIKFSLD